MGTVVVVGSLNEDVVSRLRRRPAAGETVLADRLDVFAGGKGGNQAAAASLLGADVVMVGRVGADAAGERQVDDLLAHAVDPGPVTRDPVLPTGRAIVSVTPDGENTIVVHPGANHGLTREDVRAATARLGAVHVVLAQTEVGAAPVEEAARRAEALGARFVLSMAPVVALDAATLRRCDPLVVNEHEAAELLEGAAATGDAGVATALRLRTGCASVVVTLGARGAVLSWADEDVPVPAQPAVVVDSTGAGDAFAGALAARLSDGADLRRAAGAASSAAAHAVGLHGARPAFARALPAEEVQRSSAPP